MISLPAPLPPIGGTIATHIGTIQDVDTALAFLWQERLFGLVDATTFLALDASAQAQLHLRLQQLRHQMALRHQAQWHDLQPCLEAFHDADIVPVALKGAALSSRYYPTPHARPSSDIDLFVAETDMPRVHNIMTAQGWHLPSGVRGDVITGQCSYRTKRSPQLSTTIDFHWRITNRPSLQSFLSYEDVQARSTPPPTAFPGCRLISPLDAWIHGIIHLVAHHYREPICALWYLDLALLDTVLSPFERNQAVDRLRHAGLLSIAGQVWRDMATTIDYTPSPETHFLLDLSPSWWEKHRLLPDTRWQEIMADLLATPASQRMTYVRELLFPPAASIRAAYHDESNTTPLWKLYLRRLRQGGIQPDKSTKSS